MRPRPTVPRVTPGRRVDFENGLVLLIGWIVAFAVTWT
jgi:hypothetical protein